MREIVQTKQFKKDYKKAARSGYYSIADFLELVELLAQDKQLPKKYSDHALMGEWLGYRECHIKPDWLLIDKKTDRNRLSLILVRIGSHSELFA